MDIYSKIVRNTYLYINNTGANVFNYAQPHKECLRMVVSDYFTSISRQTLN